jgi:hypothetical protein
MNLHFGRGTNTPDARMEAELSSWLRAFEPAATPIALRVRVSADLRAEAQRPRGPLPWLVPVLSSMASLAAVVGVGLILLLAMASASQIHSVGGPGAVSPPDLGNQTGSSDLSWWPFYADPAMVLLLLAFAALIAASVCLGSVRAAIGRVVLGKNAGPPADLVSFRRPVRSIPRLTWALGALAIATALWFELVLGGMDFLLPGIPVLSLSSIAVAFAVALRYPRRDRSSKLMLLGSLVIELDMVLLGAVRTGTWVPLHWFFALEVVVSLLSNLAFVVLAAGLATRSGRAFRPAPILAVVAIGGAFLVQVKGSDVMYVTLGVSPGELVLAAANAMAGLLTVVAWLAILWVALRASLQRHGTWGWKLLVVACVGKIVELGISSLINSMPWSAEEALLPIRLLQAAQTVEWTFLLAALLVGLRPVVTAGAPFAAEPAAVPVADERAEA